MEFTKLLENTGVGIAANGINNLMQLGQQGRLQRQEIAGQKEMAEFNRLQQMKLWRDTNFAAQRAEMEKAGFNPGLIMSKGPGQGGHTNATPGTVTGGKAEGNGLMAGIAMQMQQAQIENLNADTEKKKVEAGKLGGVDTAEVQGRIAKMAQETENAAMQKQLMEYDKQLKEIEVQYKGQASEASINQIKAATDKIIEETKSAAAAAGVDQATVDSKITQIRQGAVEQSLRMELQQQNIITQAATTVEIYNKIGKIAEEIVNMQKNTALRQSELDLDRQKLILDKIHTEFGTGDDAKFIRWMNAIAPIAGSAARGAGGAR